MSWVFLNGFGMLVNLSSVSSVSLEFVCPFCHCRFFSQVDLDLHLDAFVNKPHLSLWSSAHVQLEVDGRNAGVDNHGVGMDFDLDKRKSRYWRKSRRGFRRK